MLTWLTGRLRGRAAIALAAAYSFCVMFPPVALAFADGALAAHCLTYDHRIAAHVQDNGDHHGIAHVHGDGTAHKHADNAGSPNGSDNQQAKYLGSCCGLFCLAAVTTEFDAVGRQLAHASAVLPACEETLAGRGPGRIDRPPSTTFMSF